MATNPWNPDFGIRFVTLHLDARGAERSTSWDYVEGPPGAGWYRVGYIGAQEVSWDGPFSTRRIAEGK
jgi:hypothetical protein